MLRDTDQIDEPGARYRVHPLPVGDGVQPGVDLTDSASLVELMEGR